MEIKSRKQAVADGDKFYFTGNPCVRGEISKRLTSNKTCLCEKCKAAQKECKKSYERLNKDKIKEQTRRYRETNKIAIREKQREWCARNKDKIKEYVDANRDLYRRSSRNWYARNKAKASRAASDRRKEDPLPYFIRDCLRRVHIRKRAEKYEIIVGYSKEKLRQRLEIQFKDGMSWDNYGEWHIDHKKPISRFIKQGVTDPKIINALSNLQPLWANENFTKSDSF